MGDTIRYDTSAESRDESRAIGTDTDSRDESLLRATAAAALLRGLLALDESVPAGLRSGAGRLGFGQLLGDGEEELVDVHRRLRRRLHEEQRVLLGVHLRLLQSQAAHSSHIKKHINRKLPASSSNRICKKWKQHVQ